MGKDNKKNNVALNFLGIGAAKSGTTWLADCLREHPEIFIPRQKEINYFDSNERKSNYSRGFKWYVKFFNDAPIGSINGEFSTNYMLSKDSYKLIKKHYPTVKMLTCLRRPDDMLYSFYWWKKANFSSGSIADTFEGELNRDKDLLVRGMYFEQLKRYYDNFPNENIKVFLFSDIKSNPSKVLKSTYNFLGVDSKFKPSILGKKVNTSKRVRYRLFADMVNFGVAMLDKKGLNRFVLDLQSSKRLSTIYSFFNKKSFRYPPMSSRTRERLIKYYKTDIMNLEKLIGVTLGKWLTYEVN